jgi:hypothetical protein
MSFCKNLRMDFKEIDPAGQRHAVNLIITYLEE